MTAGAYHVRLPDGRLQTVEYTVDTRGYHATVLYSPTPAPAPALAAPHAPHAPPPHVPVIYLEDRGPGPGQPAVYPSLQPLQAAFSPAYSLPSGPGDFTSPPRPFHASYPALSTQPTHYPVPTAPTSIPLTSYVLPQAECKLKF